MRNLHGTLHCLRIANKKFLEKWDFARDELRSYDTKYRCSRLEDMVVSCLLEIQLLQQQVERLKEDKKQFIAGVTGLSREEPDD